MDEFLGEFSYVFFSAHDGCFFKNIGKTASLKLTYWLMVLKSQTTTWDVFETRSK